MNRLQRLTVTVSALVGLTLPALASGPAGAPGVSGAEAKHGLQQGNERFATGHSATHDFARDRAALVSGQHPFAVVLACADSRVAPEILFDESLGRLFVVRVAGNVVDSDVLGSIEYAAEHLHTHYLLVMGHDACGAVSATLAGGDAAEHTAGRVDREEGI